MVIYDNIVIGSGISALGAVLGLNRQQRTLVLAGPTAESFCHYNLQRLVPCAYLGLGGLGNYWHGVIPMSQTSNFGSSSDADFTALFKKFYPRVALPRHLRQPRFFVPWRPIRPAQEFKSLAQSHGSRLEIHAQTADRFIWKDTRIEVIATDGARYRGRRVWIAAGSIHTPPLLERSTGSKFSRGFVSDHAVSYVGMLYEQQPPEIARNRDGVLFPAHYASSGGSVYTLRPARFAFGRLDFGIEQRAVFGMPTGSAVSKIMRRFSPGLIAEALYNRAGMFPKAKAYSVYAQTLVRDAYKLGTGTLPLEARTELILRATGEARERAPFPGLRVSQRRDLYIPGIHLHHSVDLAALTAAGINQEGSSVQVVDASAVQDIGPDHHSFKLMLQACMRTRAVEGH